MTFVEWWPASGRADGIRDLAGSVAEVLAKRRKANTREPLEIVLHAGRYESSTAVTFGPDDLGYEDAPISVRTAGDGEVLVSGSRRLRATVGDDGVAEFDLAADPVLADVGEIAQVYSGGRRLIPARYPDHDPENPYFGGFLYADAPPAGEEASRDRFWCRDPRLATWTGIAGADVDVVPRHGYRNCHARVEGYDADTGEVRLESPITYIIDPGDRFYFQHLPDELDAPGEWIHLADQQCIRYVPLHGEQPGEVVEIDVPVARNVILVQGVTEAVPALTVENWPYWDDLLRHVERPENVTRGFVSITSITIEGSTASAVVLEQARGCEVVACTVRGAGHRGVEVLGGAACVVRDCDVSITGYDGIVVAGGMNRPFEVKWLVADHVVSNCYVHHIGFQEKHVAGISVAGVGNTVAHGLIHDCPRWGILSRGSNHNIEYNHIRHVNIETADTSGIYTCDRDLLMRGTVIRFNKVHDILGYEKVEDGWRFPSYAFGIYLDDWTSHVTVHGNLTYNTPRGGVYLNSGQANTVTNNCCLSGRRELAYFHRWPADMEALRLGTYNQGLRRNVMERNLYVGNGEGSVLYAFGKCLEDDGEVDVATNEWNHNLIWNDGQPLVARGISGTATRDYSWEEWRAMGHDTDSVVADPGFADLAAEDFSLAAESPAFSIGFEPLPLDLMGIQPSPVRANWPPPEVDGIRETMDRDLRAVGNAS
jgi:hypothetical protein